MKIFLWIFLSVAAWQDYHSKSVPVWLYLIFTAIGFILRYQSAGFWNPLDLFGSIAAGVLLLWICVLTKGGIGEGDGWFFVVSGLYLSWIHNWELLIWGLGFCCIYAGCQLISSGFQFHHIRSKTIAFLPFLLIPGLWVICL